MFSAVRALFSPRLPADALYIAVVAKAREPSWYGAGAVPDTVDGRFDTLVLVFALVHRALERRGSSTGFMVNLTEQFVSDMDASLREMGIGDMVIGKHLGRMTGALGGRLGAYRTALDSGEGLAGALVRNLYRGDTPAAAALSWTIATTAELETELETMTLPRLEAGQFR